MPHFVMSTFVRQTPPELLRAYFQLRGVPIEVYDQRQERLKGVLLGLEQLEDQRRAMVERELRDVFLLANRAGTRTLLDSVALFGLPLSDYLASMDNHYARAMWLFLHPVQEGIDLWGYCSTFARLHELSFSRARRLRNLPRVEPDHGAEALEEMASALSALYRLQGRGQHCIVEYAFRPNPARHCHFAYPEDYSTSELEYEGASLCRRSHRPVFLVAFVYRPEEGILEVSAPGARSEITSLQEVFARYALGLSTLPDPDVEPCWNLNLLKQPHLAFPTDPRHHIAKVEVMALRLQVAGTRGGRITVEKNPRSLATMHDCLDRMVNQREVPLRMLDVRWAKLRVYWVREGNKRARTLTFTLSHPDGISLGDDPTHQLIKGYLPTWKLAA